jgi:hypothetical protein
MALNEAFRHQITLSSSFFNNGDKKNANIWEMFSIFAAPKGTFSGGQVQNKGN